MKQNRSILVGLTGGISTGKSTVASILKNKGYSLIDADKIAREIVEINKPAYIKIIEIFGEEILLKDYNIDRKKLGTIIFSNNSYRKALNSITHPHIFKEIKIQIDRISKENKVIFLDIPLLFEQFHLFKEYDIELDFIWLVYLDKKKQILRLTERDKISEKEAEKRINSQMDMKYKKTRSSKIIDNSGDIQELEKQIEKLLKELF